MAFVDSQPPPHAWQRIVGDGHDFDLLRRRAVCGHRPYTSFSHRRTPSISLMKRRTPRVAIFPLAGEDGFFFMPSVESTLKPNVYGLSFAIHVQSIGFNT